MMSPNWMSECPQLMLSSARRMNSLNQGDSKMAGQVGVLFSRTVHDAEALVHDIALALPHAAGEVHIHIHIAINIIQRHPVGVLHIDGLLPGVAPVAQVFLGERFGLQLQFYRYFANPSPFPWVGQVYFTYLHRVLFLIVVCHNLTRYNCSFRPTRNARGCGSPLLLWDR